MTRWIETKLGPLSASDREWIDVFVARLERVMRDWKRRRPLMVAQQNRRALANLRVR